MMPWLRVPRRRDGPTVAKDKYKTGKSQDPPTKHQLQAVKERTKEHDVAEAAHQDPDYWHSAPEDEEKTAQLAKHAVSEGTKAVTKFEAATSKK